MNLIQTEEHKLFQQSVERFVEEQCSFGARTSIREAIPGETPSQWLTFADMGWLGLGVAEKYGGLGAAHIEIAILAQSFGQGIVPEPYWSTNIVGAGILEKAETFAQRQEVLSKIVEGECKISLAVNEPSVVFDPANPSTRFEKTENRFVLNGRKSVVQFAPEANFFLVPAKSEKGEFALFLLDAAAPGFQEKSYRLLDGTPASEIEMRNLNVKPGACVGVGDELLQAYTEALDDATLALCFEAIGAMNKLVKLTLEYVKLREQFDTPIGKFQVIQHRMADMFIETELARSACLLCLSVRAEDKAQREKEISQTQLQVAKAATFVGAQSIQLHGGIAMTDEYEVGQYVKRLMVIESCLGGEQYHRRRLRRMKLAA